MDKSNFTQPDSEQPNALRRQTLSDLLATRPQVSANELHERLLFWSLHLEASRDLSSEGDDLLRSALKQSTEEKDDEEASTRSPLPLSERAFQQLKITNRPLSSPNHKDTHQYTYPYSPPDTGSQNSAGAAAADHGNVVEAIKETMSLHGTKDAENAVKVIEEQSSIRDAETHARGLRLSVEQGALNTSRPIPNGFWSFENKAAADTTSRSSSHGTMRLVDVTEDDYSSHPSAKACGQPSLQKLYSLLDGGAEVSEDVTTLQGELRALRKEVEQLRRTDLPGKGTELWPTLHYVDCPLEKNGTVYLESPSYTWKQRHDHLQGNRIVRAMEWEKRHPEKPFVVYLDYHCTESKNLSACELDRPFAPRNSTTTSSRSITSTRQSVAITSPSLRKTLADFFHISSILQAYWDDDVIKDNRLKWPYYFYHHAKMQLKEFCDNVSDTSRQAELNTLIDYLSAQSSQDSKVVLQSLNERRIDVRNLPFLFAPGTLLVCDREGVPTVVCQKSPINVVDVPLNARRNQNSGGLKLYFNCGLEVSSMVFDGRFWEAEKPQDLAMREICDGVVAFDDLDPLPLSLASPETRDYLAGRGRKFWSCRHGLYATSKTASADSETGVSVRYMIDADAYRIVNKNRRELLQGSYLHRGKAEIHPGEDPDETFLLQLPPRIHGFNMQDKTWVDLSVADIQPVVWDKSAFGNLALEESTKELIEALVRNKIDSDQSIDFVKGKGVGLIVLLHGGPGTGKTLTAETVAEIAEKPLYRVTCGAMGTSAMEVEKNLESVFHLGRRWRCVVLLDEADVFLESRSLSDLARNALVSVFLRVIEYFDGIMILTSNRVATFDEAFKSRIQLALHYRSLDESQRLQVWQNFIRNLETVKEPTAIEDIKSHLSELSKFRMNGRQIRNAINTARQLARFKRKPLSFEHLRHVIEVSGKFDDYVRSINEVKDDEQWAREHFLR